MQLHRAVLVSTSGNREKYEQYITTIQRTTRRCSGEYFKWVNFFGKGNTHLKRNTEAAYDEEKNI